MFMLKISQVGETGAEQWKYGGIKCNANWQRSEAM